MKYVALYNPLAGQGKGKEEAEILSIVFYEDEFTYVDIRTVSDYQEFFDSLPETTGVVVCGGDGTLNRFINATNVVREKRPIYYLPCGSGNDFAREVGVEGKWISLKDWVKNLPVVCVNGKEYRFLNGVGFGIDGYCCEVGDKLKKENPNAKINYTSIAVKGLLGRYKPTSAIVTVDGRRSGFSKVWLAPTMHGKYYGGGMIPTPDQRRDDASGKNSVMIFHHCGKLKALLMFPSLFKGEHVKYKHNITTFSGDVITVQFQSPRALQIDGETIVNVKEYTVKSPYALAEENRKKRIG